MGGDLIKEARRRAGLTQAELAERAGTTQSAIARWERGLVDPGFDKVRQLLRLCGLALYVQLEPWEDGLESDLSQAHQWQRRSPRSRMEENARLVNMYKEMRASAKRQWAKRDAG
jgi:transcriptional regulator with XRE-family HTH domain